MRCDCVIAAAIVMFGVAQPFWVAAAAAGLKPRGTTVESCRFGIIAFETSGSPEAQPAFLCGAIA